MHSRSTVRQLAAFSMGYSLTIIKDRINSEGNRPNKRAVLNKSILQIETFRECYALLFGETLDIPFEYVSDSQMVDFFASLFEITEDKIVRHFNENLQMYFCAGGLIYLSDSTNVLFEQKKFKAIFYEMLCQLGAKITWNDISSITSRLYCDELDSKRAAKKQIIDFMFSANENENGHFALFYPERIYQSMLA